jgi:hypothetical protein
LVLQVDKNPYSLIQKPVIVLLHTIMLYDASQWILFPAGEYHNFKRKTKIAEESVNRGGTNWRQFTQGIPVVDASINVPFFPFGMW